MKQLVQSYKSGELDLIDVPASLCLDNGVLIKTDVSLVSGGTEKMIIDLAKKSLIGKAKARPDLVKQLLNKMRNEGIRTTLGKAFSKLDTPIPLGYSCAGRVMEIGKNVQGISIEDRVACAGAGYANHSEINYIPKNLFVKIPENVKNYDAAFVTVGAVALQGVRQAGPNIGESVAVFGLGLIGLLTIQILKANGCRVLGCDIDEGKIKLAKELGADLACTPDGVVETANQLSEGNGVDRVIITAATRSNQPIVQAGEIARKRGIVVVVGLVGMEIPRDLYYRKELDIRLSTSYGPGRYDPVYEEKGIDYPYAYVRWTEQRNLHAFLGLISNGMVAPQKLVTHIFDFNDSLKAYEMLSGKNTDDYVGILLKYSDEVEQKPVVFISKKTAVKTRSGTQKLRLGVIGAGNFAKSVMLPVIRRNREIKLIGLCTSTGISANSTGRKYGFEYITTDESKVYADEKINAVVITTQHSNHAAGVIKAIKNGKHVFVEKPLCIGFEELEQIVQTYNRNRQSTILQVGLNRRFSYLINKAKAYLNCEAVHVHYRINAGIVPGDSWIQDRQIGGGRIIGEVCHFVDTCSYIANSPVKSVFATYVDSKESDIPREDNISVILNMKSGSTATIVYCAFGNKLMAKEYIEIFGRGVSMILSDFRKLIIYRKHRKIKFRRHNQDKGFAEEFRVFATSIRTGVPAISFESIYNTTLTTFKIHESLRQRKPVEV